MLFAIWEIVKPKTFWSPGSSGWLAARLTLARTSLALVLTYLNSVSYVFTDPNSWLREPKRGRVHLQDLLLWLATYLSSPPVASILVFPLPVHSSHHPATSEDPSGCDFFWLATWLQKHSVKVKTETVIFIWVKLSSLMLWNCQSVQQQVFTGALFTWIISQFFQLLANMHCKGDARASLLLPCVLSCPSLCAYCSGDVV